MPTPAQVSWQAWASAAMGAKGSSFSPTPRFQQWVSTTENPPPLRCFLGISDELQYRKLSRASEFSRVQPGPQLLQLQNQTIPDIRSIENILLASHTLIDAPPNADAGELCWCQLPGDYINFLGASGGVTYVAIVSSPERTTGSITLSLNKAVQSLVPMGNAPALALSKGKGTLTLPPGGGAVYQVIEGEGETSGGGSSGGSSSGGSSSDGTPQTPSSGQQPSPSTGGRAGGR